MCSFNILHIPDFSIFGWNFLPDDFSFMKKTSSIIWDKMMVQIWLKFISVSALRHGLSVFFVFLSLSCVSVIIIEQDMMIQVMCYTIVTCFMWSKKLFWELVACDMAGFYIKLISNIIETSTTYSNEIDKYIVILWSWLLYWLLIL